ncbi:hypothetical protein V501_00256 [Pseudogymnoascus sp. VKM F-4519 (FW-2642)]|nr:hypothetical protein V501_00256 [Pseudogymnoascus sp. VKM F-4519 (FW-2642)]
MPEQETEESKRVGEGGDDYAALTSLYFFFDSDIMEQVHRTPSRYKALDMRSIEAQEYRQSSDRSMVNFGNYKLDLRLTLSDSCGATDNCTTMETSSIRSVLPYAADRPELGIVSPRLLGVASNLANTLFHRSPRALHVLVSASYNTTGQIILNAVRTRHVNVVDLIEWGRKGGDIGETNIQIFKSVTELSEYSKRTGKVFRNNLASSDNGNVVLRHLLRLPTWAYYSPNRYQAHNKTGGPISMEYLNSWKGCTVQQTTKQALDWGLYIDLRNGAGVHFKAVLAEGPADYEQETRLVTTSIALDALEKSREHPAGDTITLQLSAKEWRERFNAEVAIKRGSRDRDDGN